MAWNECGYSFPRPCLTPKGRAPPYEYFSKNDGFSAILTHNQKFNETKISALSGKPLSGKVLGNYRIDCRRIRRMRYYRKFLRLGLAKTRVRELAQRARNVCQNSGKYRFWGGGGWRVGRWGGWRAPSQNLSFGSHFGPYLLRSQPLGPNSSVIFPL